MPWMIWSRDGSYFGVDAAVLIDVPEDEAEEACNSDTFEELLEKKAKTAPELSDLLRPYIESEGGVI